uniref:Dimethylglycine dehydrogenase n=1 Tax=Hirondellea gigas TaxID=1518452 RepID=A0A6A7GBP2_9CRUS
MFTRRRLTQHLVKRFSLRTISNDIKPSAELDSVTTCSAVVVGGGIAGCSVLYHLAKAGIDSILCEKSELTSGSTWHAAGLVAAFHPGVNMRFLHHYSIDLYKRLEAETGHPTGFHTPDSIRLIDETRLDEANYQLGKSALYDYHQEWISPEQISELHPLVNLDGVVGGIYNKVDGHIDPSSVTNALASGARQHGGKIFKFTEVFGLQKRNDGKWDVLIRQTQNQTERRIVADMIINCGGLWCANVGKMAGVYVPISHIEHQYLITERIPEVEEFEKSRGKQLPVLRDLVGSYYVRQERDGLLFGPYESQEAMKLVDRWSTSTVSQPPNSFGMELFEEDVDRLTPHIEHSMMRLPCMANAGIRSVVNDGLRMEIL